MGSAPKLRVSSRVVFGPFEFDAATSELRKHGSRIRLVGQPLQILSCLLDQPGQIVTREELQQHLWQGTTFVDFDRGLNAAMNKLRQALGDSADQPRYVETLPGKGYRFIAPIHRAQPGPVVEIARPVTTVPSDEALQPRADSRWIGVAAVTAVACLTAGYGIGIDRQRPVSAPPPLRFVVSPPAGFVLEPSSSRQSFALSPDGARLAFTAMNESGLFSVFLREFNALESRQVATTVGTHALFWAPDNRSLFHTVSGKLRRSSLEGNSYQVICDAPSIMLAGALLRPDTLLLDARAASYTVPASGGASLALKERYSWPQVLPDGQHILYTSFDPRSNRYHARITQFGEPDSARHILEADSKVVYAPSIEKPGDGYLLAVRAGNLLAYPFDLGARTVTGEPLAVASHVYSFQPTGGADFSVSTNGVLAYQSYVSRSQLAWVDRTGHLAGRIGPANVNLKYVRLSPDGGKVATSIYDVDRGVGDIWVFDTSTGTGRRVTAGPGLTDSPVWAPDMSKLVFLRASGAPPKLFVRGIGVNDAEEALPSGFFQLPTDWSPDGRFVAYMNTAFTHVDNEQQGDVWLMEMAPKRRIVPLLNTPFHEANAVFSPDGRWLAFTSSESGRTEVYIQAFQGGESPRVYGERHLVSHEGAFCLRWRRDGKEIFYLGFDGRLHAVSVKLSPKLETGAPAPLFAISTEARTALHSSIGFDVSVDGSRFVVPVVTTRESSSIVVIQNWETAIRKKNG